MRPGSSGLRQTQPPRLGGVLAGVCPFDLGQELVEQVLFLAIGDHFVDHLVQPVGASKAVQEGLEGIAVLAEAVQLFRSEGGVEELADGGHVESRAVFVHRVTSNVKRNRFLCGSAEGCVPRNLPGPQPWASPARANSCTCSSAASRVSVQRWARCMPRS